MVNAFNSVLIVSFWGAGLTVLCLFFNKVFKKLLPSYWHYYIWMIVIIRLLVPTFVTLGIEPKEKSFINEIQTVMSKEVVNLNTSPIIGYREAVLPSEDLYQTNKQTNPTLSAFFIFSNLWIPWLAIVILIISIKLLSHFYYTRNLVKQKISLSERELNIFKERKMALNIKRKITPFKTDSVIIPFAVGCFNPMIIMPCKEFTDTQLTHIFHHELIHIKRNDIALKWLIEIAKSVHWFNPFIYIASKRLSHYCEISCDESVLKDSNLEERKKYGLTVIDVINQEIKQKTSVCVSMGNNKSNLKQRIHNILNCERHKKSIALVITVSTLALLVCVCSGIKLEKKPITEQVPTLTSQGKTKIKTNFLIVGIDDGKEFGRADIIMVGSFDSENNMVSLMSIPRDTYLSPSDETVSALSRNGIEIPKEVKFGEMIVYAGGNMEYLQNEIKNTFGISTDYYIKVDMSAFGKVVDTVGVVEMTIADGGLHYSDPYQNLEISINEGKQLLDGEKALMLMRYRKTYSNGDLDRITVQQQFVKKIYSKIIDGDKALDKLTALISVLIENTETNLTMTDFMLYSQFIPKMSAEGIFIFTLPVNTEMIDNRVFSIPDINEFNNSVMNIFK